MGKTRKSVAQKAREARQRGQLRRQITKAVTANQPRTRATEKPPQPKKGSADENPAQPIFVQRVGACIKFV